MMPQSAKSRISARVPRIDGNGPEALVTSESAPRIAPERKPAGNDVRRKRPRRRQALIDAAARRFRREGYNKASVRDIAEDVGILSGSIYYHFASKEELLIAVHEAGVKRISDEVLRAIAACVDPWDRLERACAAHLSALLDGSDYAQVVVRELPREPGAARTRMIRLRDQYEAIFLKLIENLPLRKPVDRKYLRLLLLGALNWSQDWYHKGNGRDRDTPAEIAKKFVGLVRDPVDRGER